MKKADVLRFKLNLEDNLFQLHRELEAKAYRHSNYTAFSVCDPKPRKIHKAIIRDRILHHAVFRVLYPIFDRTFIFDSYSCRLEKGTHRAVRQLEKFFRKLNSGCPRNIFTLKCDIKKYFASVNQDILTGLIRRKITDEDAIWLIRQIISSFPEGLPLGNVTSQLFANIYLNELDRFIKHVLREKYYLRYCDDFLILGKNEKYLYDLIPQIDKFLQNRLKLNFHPDKIILRKFRQGIDFLGYIVLPHHTVLQTKTKRRIMKKLRAKYANWQNGIIAEESFSQSWQSYLGMLKHCRGWKVQEAINDEIFPSTLSVDRR